jgi:hypothetical protein
MSAAYVPFVGVWVLLAISVCVLIVWRKVVANHEDDSLHMTNVEAVVPQQQAVARKLDMIDRWGKMLTVATVILGLAIAAVYLYRMWVATSTTIPG